LKQLIKRCGCARGNFVHVLAQQGKPPNELRQIDGAPDMQDVPAGRGNTVRQ
jgi:hypothetical protein